MSDKDNSNDLKERRVKNRRSRSLPEDFVNRRKGEDRRKEDIAIDFPDRRIKQRRAKIVGVDFDDRRIRDRRKDPK